MHLQKDEIKAQHARVIDDLAQRHRREMDTELHIIQRRFMLHEIELERKQLEEVTHSFTSGMHLYEFVAPNVDINLQSGKF